MQQPLWIRCPTCKCVFALHMIVVLYWFHHSFRWRYLDLINVNVTSTSSDTLCNECPHMVKKRFSDQALYSPDQTLVCFHRFIGIEVRIVL